MMILAFCLIPTIQRWNDYLVAPAARILQASAIQGEPYRFNYVMTRVITFLGGIRYAIPPYDC
jgi:hypothetical protein